MLLFVKWRRKSGHGILLSVVVPEEIAAMLDPLIRRFSLWSRGGKLTNQSPRRGAECGPRMVIIAWQSENISLIKAPLPASLDFVQDAGWSLRPSEMQRA